LRFRLGCGSRRRHGVFLILALGLIIVSPIGRAAAIKVPWSLDLAFAGELETASGIKV
jgi:membrane-associated PAP2 superfamily phosphatase